MRKKLWMCLLMFVLLGSINVFAQGNQNEKLLAGEEVTPGVTNNQGRQNYTVWASPIKSYLMDNGDGTLTRVEYDGAGILVEVYNAAYQMISQKTISMELGIFGGFYSAEKYNFLIFGQTNPEQNNDKEVIRVVRYTKDWLRKDHASLCGANTTVPFDAGSLRATECNGILYIRTSHEMYKSSDGLNHQANLTMSVNMETMEITDSFYNVMNIGYGYASHSFNQFIQVDGNTFLAVDHGDAYPRSVVLVKYARPAGQEAFSGRVSYVDVFPITGNIGANATGVSVGGFECSDTSYLVAGNTSPQGAAYNPNGQRNIFLTVTSKSDFSENGTDIHYLTSYTDEDEVEISTPHLVKIDGKHFALLWTEDGELCYVFLDANGDTTSKIYRTLCALSDCKPIVYNNSICWYVTNYSEPAFFAIPLDHPETPQIHAPEITITLEPEGGILGNHTVTRSYGQLVGELPVPERKSAYKFLGWYTHKYGSDSVTADMFIIGFSDMTLYARWEYVEHTCEYVEAKVIPPTCTSGKSVKYECKYCDLGYTVSDSIYQHTWDKGTVIVPATCTEWGEILYSCTLCPEKETQYVEPSCPSSIFWDRPLLSSWAHEGVDFAIAHHLFNGMSADRFEPETAMSRAMLVTVLWRYAGQPVEGSNTFMDVDNGRWYTQAIAWASENGVVNGIGQGRFAPDQQITREQMAVILYRYSQKQGFNTEKRVDLNRFPDANNVSRYAREAVEWAVAEGLIKGQGDFLKPQGEATRAQVATILMRYIQNVTER